MNQRVDEACAAGARLARVGDHLGVSPRTRQRWRAVAGLKADGRAAAAQARAPANRLSAHERQAILTLVNQPAFADRPPSQIVPALADQGGVSGLGIDLLSGTQGGSQETPSK